jgi:DNA polymerase-3 subunit epsilon
MKYAVVDIETTGGNHKTGRITEVAIILHNGSEVEGHFESLINPMEPIPPFITRLTGIDNAMVATAPEFGDIAWLVNRLLSDRIFVAHNVSFDYSFIKHEFARIGLDFTSDRLCTVRSSRTIFPGFSSYSLGNLCKSMDIHVMDRHRAAGDALATAELFSRLNAKAAKKLLRMVQRAEVPIAG